MRSDMKRISMEQFENMVSILNPCMDDFLYIYDLQNDYYCISPSAVNRFMVPKAQFHNVTETHAEFVYTDDFIILEEDLQEILNKEKKFHNLQYRWVGKDGKPVWINCRGQVTYDEKGEPEFLIGCINEIGKKQMADNVSGLLGENSLLQEMKDCGHKRLSGFWLRLGIDHFKEINENKGIDYGDMILNKMAECIKSVILPDQKLYKIVADEFVVIDAMGRTVEDAHHLYDAIRRRVDSFLEDNGYDVFFTISAGILDFDCEENQTYYNMMKLSEFALSEAKSKGRNRHYIYDKKDYKLFLQKKELLQVIRNAVERGYEGFEAYFQPIVDIKERRLYCAETLMRFKSEQTGSVPPVQFIPLLEESGLMIPAGRWILDQALSACAEIRKEIPDFKVSVNVSYVQVLKSNVLADILACVEKYDLAPDSIIVELTESGFLEANNNFINFCEGLKKNGIPLALDDFGTGYSNFHYLYNLSPNTIKIDRSFTLKALQNDYEYNLLQHMVDMTHSVDTKFCIEGIETEQELQKICNMGPDYIQGYYFGKPCPLHEFFELIHQFKKK